MLIFSPFKDDAVTYLEVKGVGLLISGSYNHNSFK